MPQVKVINDRGLPDWVEGKWFLYSWTVWLNLVGILLPVLDAILKFNLIPDKEIYALVLAVFNLLLRFKTNKPVSLEK